ncbi:MAG TPA: hypothetical protein VN648_14890, partial [Candidatus Methylomirabilis sp.]|nr:hypothetical protein [Candidatus Methylomirabilis sp.]
TVLHLLEKPIPDDMDGKVIIEAMEEEDLAASPPRYFRVGDAHMPKGHDQVFTAAEQERIETSLRALGYIE